jgi:hypothetical protein
MYIIFAYFHHQHLVIRDILCFIKKRRKEKIYVGKNVPSMSGVNEDVANEYDKYFFKM